MVYIGALKRIAILAIIAFLAISLSFVYTGQLSLFVPHVADQQETLQSLTQMLSTIVQALSGILGIVLALLFISAQLTMRERYIRVIAEVYADPETIGILTFYLMTVIYSIIILSRTELIVQQGRFLFVDIALILSIASVAALLPLLLAQIEDLNPLSLMRKISKKITSKSIKSYGLVQLELNTDKTTVKKYWLERWGHRHGNYDPLGAIHDLIMEAVSRRDRIQISFAFRCILARIAWVAKVPYKRRFGLSGENTQSGLSSYITRIADWAILHLKPCSESDLVMITLHVLHYLVRRAHNFTREWPNYDVLRQITVIAIGDFILACAKRKGTDKAIKLSMFAIMHICLGFRQVQRFGHYEPIVDLFPVAQRFEEQGQKDLAEFVISVLAFLRYNTNLIKDEQQDSCLSKISSRLRDYFNDSIQLLSRGDPLKRLWRPDHDPWDYMFERYLETGILTSDQNPKIGWES